MLGKRPSVSVCIVTQNMAHFLPHVLANVDSIADEIVVVDAFSTDGSVELLQAHPKVRLFQRTFDGHFGRQKNHAIDQARGDWVLVIDSDELLGDDLLARLPRLVSSRWHNYYKFSRYWVCSGPPWRHVHSAVHYPDLQLRLFRNRSLFRYSPDKVVHTHFPRKGRGYGRKLRGLHIFHFDFMLKDRAARESKLKRYRDLEPESATTSQMYLYEDIDYEAALCTERLSYEVTGLPKVAPGLQLSVASGQ